MLLNKSLHNEVCVTINREEPSNLNNKINKEQVDTHEPTSKPWLR